MNNFLLRYSLCVLIILLLGVVAESMGQTATPREMILWPNGVPSAKGALDEDKPTLTLHLAPAAKANGAAVVICPGGGYRNLSMDKEGHDVAAWLNTIGVTGIVLKYRLGPRYQHPAMLDDVQRAIRTVRMNADEWNIDPNRIGVMGFSAGGHLASSAGTHFVPGKKSANDPVERVHSQPDFMILCYPVISLTSSWTHKGSRQNLLGTALGTTLEDKMSSEKAVTAETPPAFIVTQSNDKAVPPQNSVAMYLALHRAGVPAELHIYEHHESHGFGLARSHPILSSWPQRCADWMNGRGILTKK
jgi:acetyl esterase/lipase